MKVFFCFVILSMVVSACGTSNGDIQGTGNGPDDYRKSSCASAKGGPCDFSIKFPRV